MRPHEKWPWSLTAVILNEAKSMRIVGEITHPQCRISLFHWNGKYLIKIEVGGLEQTFKVDELDVEGESGLREMITESFIQEALARFEAMRTSLLGALRHDKPGSGE